MRTEAWGCEEGEKEDLDLEQCLQTGSGRLLPTGAGDEGVGVLREFAIL